MPVASLICGAVALLMAVGGMFLAAVPIIGSVLSFGSPVLALAGIVLGGIGHSRSEDMKGLAIAGLVVSIIAFVLGLLVAMTCGLCNACVTAGAAGTSSAAQGFGNAGNNPANWLPQVDPNAGSTPAPPPFPAAPSDQQAPIEGETAPPVPVADILEHLNRTCRDAWCTPTNRHYLFTHVSCNASECAIHFTGYHFDRDLPGPFQGRVRIPRESVRPDGEGSVVPEPLDAALSVKLEEWVPSDEFEGTSHPQLGFVAWANEACPDGWCEGEISYDYEHVRCEGNQRCTLYFRFSDYDGDTDTVRWVPGEMSLPRSLVTTLSLAEDWGDEEDAALDAFMELTDEFTAAQVD